MSRGAHGEGRRRDGRDRSFGNMRSSTTPSSAPRSSYSRPAPTFGVVVSLKEVFGFIQPLSGEENVYFNLRDAERNIRMGDEVYFSLSQTAKGWTASDVRAFHSGNVAPNLRGPGVDTTLMTFSLKGTIQREEDSSRSLSGLISLTQEEWSLCGADKVTAKAPVSVGYMGEDTGKASAFGSKSSGKNFKNGDHVQFSMAAVGGVGYYRASGIKVLKTRKEIQMEEQIRKVLASGVLPEEGIVRSTKADYGFLKPVDRNQEEEIFFRLADVVPVASSSGETVTDAVGEGSCVEFFTIMEKNNGKMSQRAVHIKMLPKDSVKIEVTMAENTFGTLIEEPKTYPKEAPGKIKLNDPIAVVTQNGKKYDLQPDEELPSSCSWLTTVEVWPRCLPSDGGIVLRVGDEVKLNVHLYRPQKLHFARTIRMHSFRQIGRELGHIQKVVFLDSSNHSATYGFVQSIFKDCSIFFFIKDLVNDNGESYSTGGVSAALLNMPVSFELVMDDRKHPSAGGKLKAVRLQIESPEVVKTATFTILCSGIHGVVRKNSIASGGNSKECTPGVIEPCSADIPRITCALTSLESQTVDTSDPSSVYVRQGLMQFYHSKELSKYTFDYLTSVQCDTICHLLDNEVADLIASDSEDAQCLAYEAMPNVLDDTMKSVKLWKLSPSAYKEWKADKANGKGKDPKTTPKKLSILPRKSSSKNAQAAPQDISKKVPFSLGDTNIANGPLLPQFEVSFDIAVLKKSGQKVARNVCVTTGAIPSDALSEDNTFVGVIEEVAVEQKTNTVSVGYIRCIPTGEKVEWVASAVNAASVVTMPVIRTPSELHDGADLHGLTGVDAESVPASSTTAPVPAEKNAKKHKLQVGDEVSYSLRLRGSFRSAENIARLAAGTLHKTVVSSETCTALVIGESNQILPLEFKAAAGTTADVTATYSRYTDLVKYGECLQEHDTNSVAGSGAEAGAVEGDVLWDKAVLGETSAVEGPAATGDIPNHQKLHFFPTLSRTKFIPMKGSEPGAPDGTTLNWKVGSIVQCNLVYNLGVQRFPMYAENVVPHFGDDNIPLQAVAVRGKVVHVSMKCKPEVAAKLAHMFNGDVSSIPEMCEISIDGNCVDPIKGTLMAYKEPVGTSSITDTINFLHAKDNMNAAKGSIAPAAAGKAINRYFYCETKDIRYHSKEVESKDKSNTLKTGSSVVFYSVPGTQMAIRPQLAPKPLSAADLATAQRVPVNVALKSAPVKSVVLMAQGPPEKGIGFPKGWMDKRLEGAAVAATENARPHITSLSWGHLLTHLQQ